MLTLLNTAVYGCELRIFCDLAAGLGLMDAANGLQELSGVSHKQNK